MTAFASLILLILLVALSMSVVAYSNYKVARNKIVNAQLEKMKVRVEELEDVVLVLDGLCEKRAIPKYVNDEIIHHYEIMLHINPKMGYLKAGLSNAQLRSNEFSDEAAPRYISRVCKSDAQIARYQAYLTEALRILRKHHTEGHISSSELQEFTSDLEWLKLQVKVISNVTQGHKAYIKQNILAANAFYKKAQTELMKSSHPDPQRHEMITQVADILFGRRKSLDKHLMPEDDFNPDEIPDSVPDGEDEGIDGDENEEELLKEASQSMMQESETDNTTPKPQA